MEEIQTLDQFEEALKTYPFDGLTRDVVCLHSEAFLRCAETQKNSEVKKILLDIAYGRVPTSTDDWSRARAITWLDGYGDGDLIDVFVGFLQDDSIRSQALLGLIGLAENPELYQSHPPITKPLLALLEQHPDEYNLIFGVIRSACCIDAIDPLISYLDHPDIPVRCDAVRTLAGLSKIAGREDVFDHLNAVLDGLESPLVKLHTVVALHTSYPDRFPKADILKYDALAHEQN